MNESDFLARLRRLPLHPGALGLTDDAARLGDLVVTTDTLVESVHFLPSDPPGDVARKLVAVNLSDIAGKGAEVVGLLLNYPLSDDRWDNAFLDGLADALVWHGCPLIGGDTVTLPAGAPRVLTATAIGRDPHPAGRDGARAGDALWVTGTIGDAGPGLAIARGAAGPASLLAAYRTPRPLVEQGAILGARATAMMDVSDGLLIDAARMAEASGLAVTVDLAAVPLSADYRSFAGEDRQARLAAATAGDDYQLLFAMPVGERPLLEATRIGFFTPGHGTTLLDAGEPVPLPASLGYQHGLPPA